MYKIVAADEIAIVVHIAYTIINIYISLNRGARTLLFFLVFNMMILIYVLYCRYIHKYVRVQRWSIFYNICFLCAS